MPISVRNDIKKAYNLGNSFFLGDIKILDTEKNKPGNTKLSVAGGKVLFNVKPVIADQNWSDFHNQAGLTGLCAELTLSLPIGAIAAIGLGISPVIGAAGAAACVVAFNDASRNVARTVSLKFNLEEDEKGKFNDLWPLNEDAMSFGKEVKQEMDADLQVSYDLLAKIAAGNDTEDLFKLKPTFKRRHSRSDPRFVIFSDFHMTKYPTKPNYFNLLNHQLYIKVLKSYYSSRDYCLVENGDVEDIVISEYTDPEAAQRKKDAHGKSDFPISPSNSKWNDFLDGRYTKRGSNLEDIIKEYQDYYNVIRDLFISKGKYVRTTGNHDTYLEDQRESVLKNRIEKELNDSLNKLAPDYLAKKIIVRDVLTIKRNGIIKYVVLHGHQFDRSCLQHGSKPFAKSLGEVFSECLAWCNEGADRFWAVPETKRWTVGNTPESGSVTTKGNYPNVLAVEDHLPYDLPFVLSPLFNAENSQNYSATWDLLWGDLNRIKQKPAGFFETLLTTEIAWEYFENKGPYNAFTLEVWTGDENYKQRHLNEIELCEKYKEKFLAQPGIPAGTPTSNIPKVVIGHTHEPRQNAVKKSGSGFSTPYTWYLNSGSAGRYDGLIWCIEIIDNTDHIVSWSYEGNKLKKIVWKSDGDKLIHDLTIGYEYIDIVK